MHAVVVDVVAQPVGVAGAQRQGGGGFGVGVEPHQLRERQGVGFVGDIADDSARGDGGQLPVVADEAHTGTAC